MAKAQNTPVEGPDQDAPDPVFEDAVNEQYDHKDAPEKVDSIAPVEAPAGEGYVEGPAPTVESVDVDGSPFPIGYVETSEHFSLESRLLPTGSPVVTVRRNGYVGDDYDIPAAHFAEFQKLIG